MFVNKLFTYLKYACLKKQRRFNVKSSTYYFDMKAKIMADFQFCISVPLKNMNETLTIETYFITLKSC